MSQGLCLSSWLLVYLQEQASEHAEMPASGRPGYGTCGLLALMTRACLLSLSPRAHLVGSSGCTGEPGSPAWPH